MNLILMGACGQCGGLGSVLEEIDEERYPVSVTCWQCHEICQVCKKTVKRSGHECGGRQ